MNQVITPRKLGDVRRGDGMIEKRVAALEKCKDIFDTTFKRYQDDVAGQIQTLLQSVITLTTITSAQQTQIDDLQDQINNLP